MKASGLELDSCVRASIDLMNLWAVIKNHRFVPHELHWIEWIYIKWWLEMGDARQMNSVLVWTLKKFALARTRTSSGAEAM